MKRFIILSLILGTFTINAPHATAADPVYTNTDTPILQDAKFEVSAISSTQLQIKLTIVASFTVNEFSYLSYRIFKPKGAGILEKPCNVVSTWSEIGYSGIPKIQKSLNSDGTITLQSVYEEYVDPKILDNLCVGSFGLNPNDGDVQVLELIDTAKHSRKYYLYKNWELTSGQKTSWVSQDSEVWKLVPSARPVCPVVNGRFTICDTKYDVNNLQNLSISHQSIAKMLLDAKQRELEAAVAKQKAEDDAYRVKQTEILRQALQTQFLSLNDLIKIKLSVSTQSDTKTKLSSLLNLLEKLNNQISLQTVLQPGDILQNFKSQLDDIGNQINAVDINTQIKVTKTITCAKGKTIKKITGSNPKCPSGYIKK